MPLSADSQGKKDQIDLIAKRASNENTERAVKNRKFSIIFRI
jgi:hypothetical protein